MMFLLPKNIETSENSDWKFKVKVAVVFTLAVLLALLVSFLTEQPKNNWKPAITKGQDRFLIVQQVVECLFWGIGVCFLVFVGPTLTKVAPTIRLKVIGMYICVGWILISWFPHNRLHAYFHDTWSLIALDISFHWTVALSTLFLSSFVYIFLAKVSTYRCKAKLFSSRFYKNDIFHALLIIAVSFVILIAGLEREFKTTGPPPTDSQKALLKLISIVEALIFGFANALLFRSSLAAHNVKVKTIKYRSIPVIIGIWWITASWWFHSRIHSTLVGAFGAMDPKKYILVEIFFHWTSIICAALISYNIYGLIKIAVNASRSPWRNNNNSNTTTKDIEVSVVETTTSSNGEL